MGKIDRFEDLIAWQKARELTKAIYQVTRKGVFAKDFGLSGQIQRAAVSVMSNIAEGFERNRRAEFHQFLSTAKASWQRTVFNYTLLSILDTSTRAHLREFYSRLKKLPASSAACEFLSKNKGMQGGDERKYSRLKPQCSTL